MISKNIQNLKSKVETLSSSYMTITTL